MTFNQFSISDEFIQFYVFLKGFFFEENRFSWGKNE